LSQPALIVGRVTEVVLEMSPRWLGLMRWLAANGALEPGGCRVPQDELVREVEIPRRSLVRLVQHMEEAGVLLVRRTTVDGAFGSPRGANIYRLLMNPREWDERAQQVAELRLQRTYERRSAAQRAARARVATPRPPSTRAPAIAPYRPPEAEIAALAATFSDDELEGW
jgi:hypothetical protein